MLRWFLADLRTGRQILDLQPMAGTWERFLNAPEMLTCTLNMRDPDTVSLRPRISAAPGRSVLAVASGETILGAGPIWTHSYNGDAKTLKLTARGLWSYYDHRYVLPAVAATIGVNQFTIPDPSAAGKTMPNPALGTYLSGWEYGTIAKKWVLQAHAWTGGSVPVVFEADRPGTRQRNVEGAEFKNLGQVLEQLTQVEGGPDIRFRPRLTGDLRGIEWVLETGTEAEPLLAGSSVHRWSLSTFSPVSGFGVDLDGSVVAGTAWATGGRSADRVLVARSTDPFLVNEGWPMLELLDSSHSSVSEQSTLDGYAAEATTLGRGALEEWSFSVRADEQPFLSSYWEGDWCELDVPAYDFETGAGDPYLFEGLKSRRRITGFGGDLMSDDVKITTAPARVG